MVPYGTTSGTTSPTAGGTGGGAWIFIPRTTVISQIGLNVVSAGAAGDTAVMALYKKTPGSSLLSLVASETAPVSLASTGIQTATFNQTLAAGRYAAFMRFPVITGAPSLTTRSGGIFPGFYPGDISELTTDLSRGGIHPNNVGSPSGSVPFPATLTLSQATRGAANLIFLTVA